MGIRLTPIVDRSNRYLGIASVFEIANFFANFDDAVRPFYTFKLENFSLTIGGYFLKRSNKEEFIATPIIGAMPYERFVKTFESYWCEKFGTHSRQKKGHNSICNESGSASYHSYRNR